MEVANKLRSKSDLVSNVRDKFLERFKGKTNLVTK